MSENIDWDDYSVPNEGVVVSPEGYYQCATCGKTLEPTGEVDRDVQPPHSAWKCYTCDDVYWVTARGATCDG